MIERINVHTAGETKLTAGADLFRIIYQPTHLLYLVKHFSRCLDV